MRLAAPDPLEDADERVPRIIAPSSAILPPSSADTADVEGVNPISRLME
jgi:hypothetical protein